MNHKHYRRTMSDSIAEITSFGKTEPGEGNTMNMMTESNLYMTYDGDNAGRLVGRAVLANDEAGLTEASDRIAHGHDIVRQWVEENGGKIISGGGDEGTFSIPSGAVDNIEQLRSDYQFTTQLTMTIGVGKSLSEAGKSLMAGKFRGKDQVVMYDPSVDADLASAQEHISAGQGSEEENKIGEAYLNEEEPARSHADDCEYCQDEPDHEHTDDCKYCQMSESQPEAPSDHNHTDDCQWCAASATLDTHEHNGENCEYCESAAQRASEEGLADHDHTDDDCSYCGAKEQASPQANALASALLTDDPNTQTERGAVSQIDDTQAALSTGMDDGVSRPEGYGDEANPTDMGLSEDSPESQGPDFTDVLQGGLDQHADNISREKVVAMVSQALQGFKANKEILERAKEQAPDLYVSTIAMLKAMIEMAKQLGLGGDVEQDESAPQDQSAAPQEGAAPSPQQ